jgi:hypothetical protein
MQIAINAHLSQSAGAFLSGQPCSSGQQGMSPVMLVAGALPSATVAKLAESGAVNRPAIKMTARIRDSMIDRFTSPQYHGRNAMKRRAR